MLKATHQHEVTMNSLGCIETGQSSPEDHLLIMHFCMAFFKPQCHSDEHVYEWPRWIPLSHLSLNAASEAAVVNCRKALTFHISLSTGFWNWKDKSITIVHSFMENWPQDSLNPREPYFPINLLSTWYNWPSLTIPLFSKLSVFGK